MSKDEMVSKLSEDLVNHPITTKNNTRLIFTESESKKAGMKIFTADGKNGSYKAEYSDILKVTMSADGNFKIRRNSKSAPYDMVEVYGAEAAAIIELIAAITID